ncbi:hypothetical protein Kpol_467p21 [Vanderwaltozyma polyspora DSM 70294]|uniref:Anaphase-promoting complex subunit 4 WD40 domain-containing protein n=1 Tax=Vanderwaltozyma polyspora (strain ATCC 22028 / DSM 70294 / BCRC 21397 / CBS 2163 / NBRC 10782 / NRRL Y-8283 / UCD 57-17) TaxID=436907 RepID=A7TQG5_VANPO|nr:uncharacterized protein Kpol_467p21 [Vanderwaltozyma polyspora DSM 70294]EDO15509.1 hypothetical protein Kpol_467p21 [Vanderwaltozyma polyspora DSM 70294]
MSITLKNIIPPQPSTERNFSTHIDYDEATNSIAYPSGRNAFIRSLDNDSVVQFTGHGSSNVNVVKFSPIKNSQYLCSGDASGKVIVWGWSSNDDVVETIVKAEYQALAGPILDISWDFEGKRLCIVGEGREQYGIFISWDSGNSLGEISGHSKRINSCHFKQSRPMRCMTVSDDGSAVFYQGPPFKFTASDRIHHDQGKFIRDVEFSPNSGDYAVSVGSDRKICCFDGKTGEFIKYIEDPNETIEGGLFAVSWVDEKRFVTASADAAVRLWSVEEPKCLQKWLIPESIPYGNQQIGVIAAKDEQVVSLSLDGSLNFFKIGNDTVVKTIVGHNKGITALTVNPLVSGSYDGRVIEWEGTQPKANYYHNNLIVAIDSSTKGCISTVSWDDTLKTNGVTKFEFNDQPSIASADGTGSIAVIAGGVTLSIFNSETGEVLNSIELDRPASAIDLHKDLVAVGYEHSNIIEIFKATELTNSYKLNTALQAKPSCISISPSGRYVAAGDVSGKIILYDLENKDVKTTRWSFHTSKINCITWRPSEDGEENHVVTGSLDTNIFIYSVERPMKIVKYLNAHKDGVSVVQWKDTDTIVSAGADACIKEWSVETQ